MKETPCQYVKAAPDLGEDNEDIFKELGFSDAEIARFREMRVMN